MTNITIRSLSQTNQLKCLNFRTGSDPQMHDFWIEVGRQMEARLAEKPSEKIWMSTCGTGIYWLHLRLDSKPKYYTYTTYREA